ncbi:mechanosensitive ion channel family protein [Parendozoicomonas sp. Alg238-R29]|uniref:mechanosensitive ion channel family protein n=1 Tax=Parendozoicomonas sp. Alg238-R29 TaxID=2993446 RepID=UPI00248E8073|nr:mechanosensitive ion channel family protein [Parendozoicomonas sp. Alg238-R29]
MSLSELTELAPIIIKCLVTVFASSALAWLCKRILDRLTARFSRTKSHWDDTLSQAATPVIVVGILLMGASVTADLVMEHYGIQASGTIHSIRQIVVVCLLYALLMRYLRLTRESFRQAERSRLKIDLPTAELLIKLMQLGLTIATALTLLQNLGVSISGLLAFGGVGGLAIGLAAKDMLANLFGGLTLHMDRPFIIGEKVLLKDKGIEGFVEHIGWRQTRIRGYDRTPIYVPNALFTNMAVVNPSRMQNRRVDIIIGLRYKDFPLLDSVTQTIEDYLANHQSLDQVRGVLARFIDYGTSSLDIRIRFYTLTTDWKSYMNARHEILLEIGNIIHKQGADMAFPTRTLDIPANALNARADGEATPD